MASSEIIFESGFYRGKSNDYIKSDFQKQGYRAQLVNEQPNTSEEPHTHSESYIVVCLQGNMTVSSGVHDYAMTTGDKIIIPAGVEHTAVFGSSGSKYLWVKT